MILDELVNRVENRLTRWRARESERTGKLGENRWKTDEPGESGGEQVNQVDW